MFLARVFQLLLPSLLPSVWLHLQYDSVVASSNSPITSWKSLYFYRLIKLSYQKWISAGTLNEMAMKPSVSVWFKHVMPDVGLKDTRNKKALYTSDSPVSDCWPHQCACPEGNGLALWRMYLGPWQILNVDKVSTISLTELVQNILRKVGFLKAPLLHIPVSGLGVVEEVYLCRKLTCLSWMSHLAAPVMMMKIKNKPGEAWNLPFALFAAWPGHAFLQSIPQDLTFKGFLFFFWFVFYKILSAVGFQYHTMLTCLYFRHKLFTACRCPRIVWFCSFYEGFKSL